MLQGKFKFKGNNWNVNLTTLGIVYFITAVFPVYSQVANYVNNPSFELAIPNATANPFEGAAYWAALDSTKGNSHFLRSKFLSTVPHGFGGYQNARTGVSFVVSQFFCSPPTCSKSTRFYPRNRLKAILKQGVAYCVKYHIVNTNNCVLGINSFGAFFGGSWLDTTSYCEIALTYLSPQIEYYGNIFSDTLNWTPITGTFVANGTEKYMVIGNFKSNAATNTQVINPTLLPALGNDILIDDVSLIEMNIPAFAGIDTAIVPGDSAFIGRAPDIGIDEACQWFKLPNMTAAFDTVAGMWVKPANTTTYVVRQQLWCSGVKWDTVVVYMNLVGVNEKSKFIHDQIKLYPVPANDKLQIRSGSSDLIKNFSHVVIFNSLGEAIKHDELRFEGNHATLDIGSLQEGIYWLDFKSDEEEVVRKRFVVQR